MSIFTKRKGAKPESRSRASGIVQGAAPGNDAQRLLDALVMMVDDDPVILEVTQVQLEAAGYRRFLSTTEPREALALMKEKRPDVLLLDIKMPGMSGFEILERMEAENLLRDVSTIVLTSSGDAATKRQALKLGATEFLTKPVDPSELALRVKNTLAAKAYWTGCWGAGK